MQWEFLFHRLDPSGGGKEPASTFLPESAFLKVCAKWPATRQKCNGPAGSFAGPPVVCLGLAEGAKAFANPNFART
jgi:hypothetical protein